MAFIPAPFTIRSEVHWTIGENANAMDRIHWLYQNGPPSPGDLNSFATALRGQISNNFIPLVGAGVHLTNVRAIDIAASTGQEGLATGDTLGERPGAVLTAITCVLVSGRITRRYRGGRPRIYFPAGVQTDLSNSSVWDPAIVTAVQNAWQAVLNAIQGQTFGSFTINNWANVARTVDKIVQNPRKVEPVVSFTVKNIPGTQRRRYGRP